MGKAIRIWRTLLWIFGSLFVLPAASQFWLMAVMPDPDADTQRDFVMVLFGLYFLASVLALVSAFAVRRAARWARPVCWLAAAVQVFAIPMFTPLGLFGLILLARGAAKEGTMVARAAASGKKGAIASTVVAVVPLWLVIHLGFRWAQMLGYPEAHSFPLVLAILFTCIAFQLAVHEGGHALAAIALRGHVHCFQVGPISWTRESGHSQTKFLKKMQFGGMVCWTPGYVQRLNQQRFIVTAAGPLANLLTAVAAMVLFPWLGKLGIPQMWLWLMFSCAIGVSFLANLWPTVHGHQNGDGATISALLTSPDFRRMSEIGLRQSMADSSALRPRGWSRADLEWVLALEDVPPCSSNLSNNLLAGCAHYLDSGEPLEAVRCARRLHELARVDAKRCSPNSFPEATFTLAFAGEDVENARDLWARRPAGIAIQFELAECLAEAAIAVDDRPSAIRKAWECSDRYGSCGTLEYLRDQLRRLEGASAAVLASQSELS